LNSNTVYNYSGESFCEYKEEGLKEIDFVYPICIKPKDITNNVISFVQDRADS